MSSRIQSDLGAWEVRACALLDSRRAALEGLASRSSIGLEEGMQAARAMEADMQVRLWHLFRFGKEHTMCHADARPTWWSVLVWVWVCVCGIHFMAFLAKPVLNLAYGAFPHFGSKTFGKIPFAAAAGCARGLR